MNTKEPTKIALNNTPNFPTFQQLITRLNDFWQRQGCVLIQPLDMEVGAGTFHPATFLRSIGPEPWFSAYVQPSRRPTDGRYGDNPNRLQHYYQYQVLLKPAPENLQTLYLQSLEALGIDLAKNDIRFVEDNWESPTLGAWGLGWEVWLNGMEVTQFTYFQQVGGLECEVISGEITYGLERLCVYLQGVESVYDLVWTWQGDTPITYHQVYHQNEVEQSRYNFELADIPNLLGQFEQCYQHCQQLVVENLPLPAYEQVMKASHLFNLLDARKAISVTERRRYIFRVRELAHQVAVCYAKKRQALNYPLGVSQTDHSIKPSSASSSSASSSSASLSSTSEGVSLQTMKQADFLFEIGCEELPTESVWPLAKGLKKGFIHTLNEQLFSFEDIQVYATPRRLSICIKQLQLWQKSVYKTRKGPRVDAPKKAHIGFAKSCAVALADLVIENYSGVDYWVFHESTEGKHFSDIFKDLLPQIMTSLPMKKTMRWEAQGFQFPRPVRWLVALLDKQVLPCQLFGVASSNVTFGHRFQAPSHSQQGALTQTPLTLDSATSYENTLREHAVLVDFIARKDNIREQLQKQAKELSAQVNIDESLLTEVTALTEYPTVVVGDFPERFLRLPKECLMSTLQRHQKYFTLSPLEDKNKLLSQFLTVSNLPCEDFSWVKVGNERVVIPRLEDAEFFWQQDIKEPLANSLERLQSVVFIEGLGTVYEKVRRVKQLASNIALQLQQDVDTIARACDLIKCDLVSDMVNEFPDLQGIMGKYYALNTGESPEVAQIIEQHYFPKQAGGTLPSSLLSAIVAIADKLDTIVGIHILNKQPSGSSDPFSLRRAALGVMQILQEKQIELPLEHLINHAIELWHQQLSKSLPEELSSQVQEFMWVRLYTLYTKEKNIPVPFYQAVMAVKPAHPFVFMTRLQAVRDFVKMPVAKPLSETNTRIKNILQKNPIIAQEKVNSALFEHAQERHLFEALEYAKKRIQKTQDDVQILTILSELADPVEQFFTHVMVLDNHQAKRENRLSLLAQLREQFLLVADISLLQL